MTQDRNMSSTQKQTVISDRISWTGNSTKRIEVLWECVGQKFVILVGHIVEKKD